jgi:hypothetical protein
MMIAFTQLAILATCLRVSEHLHNVLTVASFNAPIYGNLFGAMIGAFLGFVVLPAMLVWLFTTGWRGKK